MEIKSICDSILWMWYGLGRAELNALIEYLTHKEIVDIHRISRDTNIPEGAVLVCVNRLYSKRLLTIAPPVPLSVSNDNSCYYRVTDRLKKYSENNIIEADIK